MNITLFNLSKTTSSDGSRLISALLKRAGHDVQTVFLSRSASIPVGASELLQLHALLDNTELVMVALYSGYTKPAIQISNYIHKKYPDLKIIWGGPHCISVPELCLDYADGVCFGEGDQAVIDLTNALRNNGDYLNTPNMAFRIDGKNKINKALPPFTDLDDLPYYDYELDDHFLLDQKLIPMSRELVLERHAFYPYEKPTFYFLTSRGCPNRCSYCNNIRYINLFGHNAVRYYSNDRIIEELKYSLNHLGFYEMVFFIDDDFLTRSKKQLDDFAQKYKKAISLPFIICASANTINKDKIEILLDAGLKCIQLGVQSGSQYILDEVFNRKIKITKTKKAIQQIKPYYKSHNLDLLVDFIVDNPYESKADMLKTYQFLLGLPKNTIVNLFFLAFFPGTPLYNRAINDGFIEPYNENESTFKFTSRNEFRVRYQKNYELLIIFLIWRFKFRNIFHLSRNNKIPKIFFDILGSRPLRNIAAMLPESFYGKIFNKLTI